LFIVRPMLMMLSAITAEGDPALHPDEALVAASGRGHVGV